MSPRNLQKYSDKLNIKTFEQYDYIIDTGKRAPGGVSILIRKYIPKIKPTSTLTCKQLQSQQAT